MVELDVRTLPPSKKHATIHELLEGLTPGDTLRIINDHDPRPLRFELEHDYPQGFDWTYVESGPQTWRVDICKTRTLRLDVRPFHERGEEPYDAIMSAVDSLQPGQEFLLVNSFEPTPLYRVMDKRGFEHESSKIAENEWHILFRPKP